MTRPTVHQTMFEIARATAKRSTSKTLTRLCEECGSIFEARLDNIRRGWGRFCSKQCAGAWCCRNRAVPVEDRLKSKSIRVGECLIWTGAPNASGYGRIVVNGEKHLVHRVAWELDNEPIPEGLYVCHNCPGGDNPLCINTDHLFLGTALDNNRDMVAKGRNTHGETHGNAKLSDADVVAIFLSPEITAAVAERFGVTQVHVSDIRAGRTRKSATREYLCQDPQ